jgi:hypothetical protein
MAKFLTGNELNSELEKLFERADEQLILISPYIKLHDRYASVLKTKKENPRVEIVIVFGKNEADISKSMKIEDFEFFRQFPNIQIRYEKRLHAKYYANESSAILTSMNLYNFSQDNNIEAGVMTKATLIGNLTSHLISNVTGEDGFDQTAFNYFKRVIEQSEILFERRPEYNNGLLGFGKKYIHSIIKEDKLTDFFQSKPRKESNLNVESNVSKVMDKMPSAVNNFKTIEENKSLASISKDEKYLSATAMSKALNITSKDLVVKLQELKWITRMNEEWQLTPTGIAKGGQIKKGQYGDYIAWPSALINEIK